MKIEDADVNVNSGDMSVSVMWINPTDIFDNAITEASHYLPGGLDHWYVNRIKVKDPKSYGKGIGSHIFGKLMETLKGRGAMKILVDPSDGYGSDVERLVEFYERFGFELKRIGPDDPSMSMEWSSDA